MKNIFILLKKEMVHNVRDKKGNIMMILFPLVLMLILGSALSSAFSNSVQLGNVKVLYYVNQSSKISNAFEQFKKQGEKLGMVFTQSNNMEDAKEEIKRLGYTCLIEIESQPEDNKGIIRFYKNNRYKFTANLVQMMMNAFVQRYNAVDAIIRHEPQMLSQLIDSHKQDNNSSQEQKEPQAFVQTVTVNRGRRPSSMDYYAVTMLTMIIMYGSITGNWSIKSEKNLRTGNRILSAPVKKYQILAAKVTGGIIITFIQAIIVIFTSKYAFGAWWGEDIATILAVILSQIVMVISLGTSLAFIFKSESASSGIINAVIPIIVYLGGGYVPLENFGGFLSDISFISPVKWINQSIFRVIYSNDYSLVMTSVIINISVALALAATASFMTRKNHNFM